MKKTKLNVKVVRSIFIVLFIICLALYFSEASGYYEFKNYKSKELTEKQIKKFENDLALGKQVDINDYAVLKNKNYGNNLSNAGSKLSDTISNLVKKGLDNTFSFIVKVIEN